MGDNPARAGIMEGGDRGRDALAPSPPSPTLQRPGSETRSQEVSTIQSRAEHRWVTELKKNRQWAIMPTQ